MKKYILMTILAGTVLIFAACGDAEVNSTPESAQNLPQAESGNVSAETPADEPENDVADTETPSNQTVDESGFAFVTGDIIINMDDYMGDVLEALGEPFGVFEAPSCAFDGIDRIFQFAAVQIHTYPVDDRDYVHTIMVRDDSVSTAGGIFLGSSFNDLISAYGSDYEHEANMFVYTRSGTTLSFLVENDMVVSILYGLIMD